MFTGRIVGVVVVAGGTKRLDGGCVQTRLLKTAAFIVVTKGWEKGGATESQILLKLLIRHSVIYKPAGGKALRANTSARCVIGQSVCAERQTV